MKDIADELALDSESYGSAVWRDRLQMAGLELDNCFYFQNEPAVRGRTDLDLRQDPPPDLALEIDIPNKSLDRFPIYAWLRVPELWCYDDGDLKIYHLQSGDYGEAEGSLALPQLPVLELPQIIEAHRSQGRRALRQAIRQRARSHATR